MTRQAFLTGDRRLSRLALRVVRGDEEAALVLADAARERGLDHVLTGRTKPIRFEVSTPEYGLRPSGAFFWVRAVEALYGLDDDHPIMRMWSTSRADIYRGLRRTIFGHNITRFRDLEWRSLYGQLLGGDFGTPTEISVRGRPALFVWPAERTAWLLEDPGGIDRR